MARIMKSIALCVALMVSVSAVGQTPMEETDGEPQMEEASSEPQMDEASSEAPMEESSAEPQMDGASSEAPIEEASAEPQMDEASSESPMEEASSEPPSQEADCPCRIADACPLECPWEDGADADSAGELANESEPADSPSELDSPSAADPAGEPQFAPTEVNVIYLLDARGDSSMPLEQALPSIKSKAQELRATVDVRAAATVSQLRDYPSMIEEFEHTRELVETSPIFFALDQPYRDTKKKLQAAIDAQDSLDAAGRRQLRRRVVMVRSTEGLGESGECFQLRGDMDYAIANFLGIGLVVDDSSIQGLNECIESTAQ